MNDELKVLLTIGSQLDKNNIPYMISGSMAANYYTVPRMTRDIDIVVELKQADVDRFIKIFETDFWIDSDTVSREVAGRGMFNVIHKECFIKVDFILRKETSFQESAFERCKKVVIENIPVWFIRLRRTPRLLVPRNAKHFWDLIPEIATRFLGTVDE